MILADTHIVLWLAFEQAKISKAARSAIDKTREKADGLAISGISLVEMATLERKGRLHLNLSFESFLLEVEAKFTVIPISGRACARTFGLPANFPQDPADRIIAATALVEGLSLVTADRQIQRSNALQTIW